MESRTIEITHFADIFHYDVTSKALQGWNIEALVITIQKCAMLLMLVVWLATSRFWTVLPRNLKKDN